MENTDYNGLTLNIDHLEALFPFYFAFNDKKILVKAGKSLTKILPSLRIRKKVSTYFSLENGDSLSFFNSLEDGMDGVLMVGKSGKLLKGSFLKSESNRLTYFLGNLSLTHIDDLKKLRLNRTDFSAHDTGVDILYHTHSNQAERNNVLEKLKKLSLQNKILSQKSDTQHHLLAQSIQLLREPMRRSVGLLPSLEKYTQQNSNEEIALSFFHFRNNLAYTKQLLDALDRYLKAKESVGFTEDVALEIVLTSVFRDLADLIEKSGSLVHLKDEAKVTANFQDLKYILTALIQNAIHFNKNPPAIVRISCEKTGNVFKFCVEDNGVGVSENSRKAIFQPLPQNTGIYNVSSMSLATCKRIIERDGGKIWVEENPSGGSRFYFTILKK